MTTTELYSGYNAEGKSSSRVLRPPGGGSSNIFGAPEPNPQQQVRQEQQKEAQKTQSPNPQGSAQSNPTNDAKQEYNRNKPKGRVQYNPITGEEYPASYGQKGKEEKKVEQETEDKKEEDSADENANDETAEENSNNNAHPTPKPEEAKPASAQIQKVRQPPGGKSSGLW